MTTKPLVEDAIPAFVKVEVKRDKELQQEIVLETSLDIEKIISNAEIALKEEEAMVAEEVEKREDALEKQEKRHHL